MDNLAIPAWDILSNDEVAEYFQDLYGDVEVLEYSLSEIAFLDGPDNQNYVRIPDYPDIQFRMSGPALESLRKLCSVGVRPWPNFSNLTKAKIASEALCRATRMQRFHISQKHKELYLLDTESVLFLGTEIIRLLGSKVVLLSSCNSSWSMKEQQTSLFCIRGIFSIERAPAVLYGFRLIFNEGRATVESMSGFISARKELAVFRDTAIHSTLQEFSSALPRIEEEVQTLASGGHFQTYAKAMDGHFQDREHAKDWARDLLTGSIRKAVVKHLDHCETPRGLLNELGGGKATENAQLAVLVGKMIKNA